MSLKTFHIVFVAISTLLAVGFGAWAIRDYLRHDELASLLIGVGSLLGGAALIGYGRWFVHKLKGIGWL